MPCSMTMPRSRTRASAVSGEACSQTMRSGAGSCAAIGAYICAYSRYSSSLRVSWAKMVSLANMKSLTTLLANIVGCAIACSCFWRWNRKNSWVCSA